MDVKRQWKKVRYKEWQCGPYTIIKVFSYVEIYRTETMRFVATKLKTIAEAKAFLTANWRALEASAKLKALEGAGARQRRLVERKRAEVKRAL